jgi:hypothetical protein
MTASYTRPDGVEMIEIEPGCYVSRPAAAKLGWVANKEPKPEPEPAEKRERKS